MSDTPIMEALDQLGRARSGEGLWEFAKVAAAEIDRLSREVEKLTATPEAGDGDG